MRWYVLYILTYFGFYGFPNELAKRIGKSLNKEEYSDMWLIVSSHVEYEALVLLLKYEYLGCLHAGEETVKKLKILAKRCKLQHLLQMLYRQRPKWGTPFPSFNLTPSLGSAGSCFSYDFLVDQLLIKYLEIACDWCNLAFSFLFMSIPIFISHKTLCINSHILE